MSREAPATSTDAIMGGRLNLMQPLRGHRVGHDAILLAAAAPAAAGERVVDLGAGVGAAGLALARRVDNVAVTLVERDPDLVNLAKKNVTLNGLEGRVAVCGYDVAEAPALLGRDGAQGVMMNPPFNDPARNRPSPDPARRMAHVGGSTLLQEWVTVAHELLAAGGWLTLIWRAEDVAAVLGALTGFGGVQVTPIFPRPSAAAIRVIATAFKGSRAPLAIRSGLTLNDETGRPSDEAEAILRNAQPLGSRR